MKKTFVIIISLAVLAACGGGDDKKGDTKKEDKPADITQTKEYQEGVEAIARTPICATCHLIEEKNVGPAWREVGNKYGGQDTAFAYLVDKVRNGGSGVWGTTPMPANTAVPKEDIEKIVRYILLLKNK